ncbi:hypothetical protein [Acetohalobium arabaticum]|nr:hypothetical protein [Acetohalobium arabaticum]
MILSTEDRFNNIVSNVDMIAEKIASLADRLDEVSEYLNKKLVKQIDV